MRINKYMSLTGYCSRRETDRLIEAKRITINGVTCEPGDIVENGDLVLLDGRPLGSKGDPVYLVLNKPVGITCTAAKHVERNIIDFVNYPQRIFPVGHLERFHCSLLNQIFPTFFFSFFTLSIVRKLYRTSPIA